MMNTINTQETSLSQLSNLSLKSLEKIASKQQKNQNAEKTDNENQKSSNYQYPEIEDKADISEAAINLLIALGDFLEEAMYGVPEDSEESADDPKTTDASNKATAKYLVKNSNLDAKSSVLEQIANIQVQGKTQEHTKSNTQNLSQVSNLTGQQKFAQQKMQKAIRAYSVA